MSLIALKPASLPWLLRHELRLSLRTKKVGPWAWALAIVWLIFMHAVGLVSAWGFSKMNLPPAAVELIFGGIGVFSAAITLAVAMQLTVNAIYTRGDLDLLLSSPLRPGLILPIRLLAVALTIMSGMVMMVAGFMHGGAILNSPRWLVGYISLPAVAILGVTLSFLLVLMLVRLLGPRRARTVAQVLAAVIGIAVALAGQLPNMNNAASGETRKQNFQAVAGFMDNPAAEPVRGLGRAMMGEPLPLSILVLVGFGGFALATLRLGPAFIRSVHAAAGADPTPRKRKASGGALSLRIRGLTGSMLWKEWRLILRDPTLLSQVASILLVAAPVVLPGLGKHVTGPTGEVMAFGWLAMVPVAGLLAGNLIWLAIVAEDAPDLLGTAPVTARRLLVDRMLAAALPALVPATALCLYLALSVPASALVTWLMVVLAIQVFLFLDMRQEPMPGGRKAFQKRYQGHYLMLMGEMLLSFALFGMVLGLLKFGTPIWTLPLLLALNAGALASLLLVPMKPR